MELRRGLGLLTQQFRALLKKNILLSWRHKRSTFLQLFSSLIFIFLIFLIQKAIQGRYSSTTIYHNVFDPKSLVSPPIPPCEDKFYIKFPCFDFIWSGNDNTRIRSIVTRILVCVWLCWVCVAVGYWVCVYERRWCRGVRRRTTTRVWRERYCRRGSVRVSVCLCYALGVLEREEKSGVCMSVCVCLWVCGVVSLGVCVWAVVSWSSDGVDGGLVFDECVCLL
ncbi:ABC transporter A family member 2 [Camellia lanceoleosa]|uniref:ABC transporter A family member 2 n=1 Tax=Camellia lanceoleosa TaxID=1840588 RepID=A0ACC0GNR8_9ERIC|nr:ABC transporter A family member 2 [Camellia lanceoleosa]